MQVGAVRGVSHVDPVASQPGGRGLGPIALRIEKHIDGHSAAHSSCEGILDCVGGQVVGEHQHLALGGSDGAEHRLADRRTLQSP